MSTLFFILLIISVPIFYIIGAIDFFKTILGKKGSNPQNHPQYLKAVTEEISEYLDKHPDAKASEVLNFFKHQLKEAGAEDHPIVFDQKIEENDSLFERVDKSEPIIPNDDQDQKAQHHPEHLKSHKEEEKKSHDLDIWKNWYSENSINLLLYVGAFFIVASASIFVGFQWESIQGLIKAILLTLLTLSFFVSGFIFYKNPKVRNAGITFAAIGALLIPLTGIGWHNFVLKDAGISIGLTWLLTSLIALAVYLGLGLYFKNKFYGYITSLALWALSLSFVSLLDLDSKYYILASILSNFFLLTFHIIVRTKDQTLKEAFAEPLEISTLILMPLTLAVGLLIALGGNMFFSLEVAVSLFLASCYYYLYYSFTQKVWQLTLSLILFPLFLFSLFGWKNALDYRLYFAEIILAFADLGIAYVMLKNKLQQPALISTVIATFLIISSFLATFIQHGGYPALIASVLLIVFGAVLSFIHQRQEYLHISSVSFLTFIYILFNQVIGLQNNQHLVGIIYLIAGAASLLATWLVKDSEKARIQILTVASLISFIISFPFCQTNQYTLLLSVITYGAILHAASYRFKIPVLLFGANSLLTIGLHLTTDVLSIDTSFRPFLFSAFALCLYGISFLFKRDQDRADRYRLSALTLALLVPSFFGLQSAFTFSILEKSALVSAFITTALFTYEATRIKNDAVTKLNYLVIGFTALWVFKFTNSTDYWLIIISFISAVGFVFASLYRAKNANYIFASNVFLLIAFIHAISFLDIADIFRPFIFALLGIGLYFIKDSFSNSPKHQENYKMSGLTITLASPIFFGLQSAIMNPGLERFALYSSFISLALITYESLTNKEKNLFPAMYSISGLIALWLFKFTSTTDYVLLALALITTIALAGASIYRTKNSLLIYISNVFLLLAVFHINTLIKIDLWYQPILFVSLGIGIYALHILFNNYPEHQEKYKYSGLALALFTPIYFGLQSISGNTLEQSALISAYMSTVLMGFEATRTKNQSFRYLTSAIALTTLLWQIKLLHLTDLQFYSIPLGMYFLILGFTRRLKKDKNGEDILNVIGICILILSSMSQAFTDNGAIYALLLALEGIAFLIAGITLNNKLFRICGIAAIIMGVLSQTYSYLFNMPKWMMTGIAGIAFLAVAVFLLTKRGDEHKLPPKRTDNDS